MHRGNYRYWQATSTTSPVFSPSRGRSRQLISRMSMPLLTAFARWSRTSRGVVNSPMQSANTNAPTAPSGSAPFTAVSIPASSTTRLKPRPTRRCCPNPMPIRPPRRSVPVAPSSRYQPINSSSPVGRHRRRDLEATAPAMPAHTPGTPTASEDATPIAART